MSDWLHRLGQWLLALSLVGCGGPAFSTEVLRAQDDAATDGTPADAVLGGDEGVGDGGSASDAAPEAGEAQACTLVTHSDGLGQTWQDCVALGTYDQAEAFRACVANGGACVLNACGAVCDIDPHSPGYCSCWDYASPLAGHVNNTANCTDPAKASCIRQPLDMAIEEDTSPQVDRAPLRGRHALLDCRRTSRVQVAGRPGAALSRRRVAGDRFSTIALTVAQRRPCAWHARPLRTST